MSGLPAALAPWRAELEGLAPEAVQVLAPMLGRLDLAIGPLSHRPGEDAGEPDGLGGISRRGPYQRLLLSEWAVALELPEEFLRRAAMQEHAFLSLARRSPAGRRRTVALFDAGPDQLGAPRLGQIAALLVLARRAARAGALFEWGVLQAPPEQGGSTPGGLSPASVRALLFARTAEPPTAAQLQRWWDALSFTADDRAELWLVGSARAGALAAGTSTLLLEEPEDPRRRELLARVVRPGRPPRGAVLPLPDPQLAVRVLRDPFRPILTPLPAPGARGVSGLGFTACGRRLYVTSSSGELFCLGLPGARVVRLTRADERPVAAGFADLHRLVLESEGLEVRLLSRRGRFAGRPRHLPRPPELAPRYEPALCRVFPLPGASRSAELAPFAFVDAGGQLCRGDLLSSRTEVLAPHVLASAARGDGLYFMTREPPRGRLVFLRLVPTAPKLERILVATELVPLRGFFGPEIPGRRDGPGPWAVEIEGGGWRLVDRRGLEELTLPADATPLGLAWERDRAALWFLADGGTTVRRAGAPGGDSLLRLPAPAVVATLSEQTGHLATADELGVIRLYDARPEPLFETRLPEVEG